MTKGLCGLLFREAAGANLGLADERLNTLQETSHTSEQPPFLSTAKLNSSKPSNLPTPCPQAHHQTIQFTPVFYSNTEELSQW